MRIEARDNDAGGTGTIRRDYEYFTLTVIPVNSNPICPTMTPKTRSVNGGAQVYTFAISDPDSTDTLTTTMTKSDYSALDTDWI